MDVLSASNQLLRIEWVAKKPGICLLQMQQLGLGRFKQARQTLAIALGQFVLELRHG